MHRRHADILGEIGWIWKNAEHEWCFDADAGIGTPVNMTEVSKNVCRNKKKTFSIQFSYKRNDTKWKKYCLLISTPLSPFCFFRSIQLCNILNDSFITNYKINTLIIAGEFVKLLSKNIQLGNWTNRILVFVCLHVCMHRL